MEFMSLSLRVFLFMASFVAFSFSHSDMTSVLLISFDGFRWDYLDKVKAAGNSTPNFDALIEDGVTINKGGLINAFITKTFPNHYTIATGLYEESHGVVHNSYYDPIYNDTFRKTPDQERDPKWWNNGDPKNGPEPIWITNEKGSEYSQFPKRSGIYFWPGSQAPTRGKYPTHYVPYDSTVPHKARIDKIIEWFSTEELPINLGLLYFEEPDQTGHSFGPNSPQMVEMIVALDGLVGYLREQLEEHHLLHHINMIITSDHGMKEISGKVFLDEHIDPNTYTHYGSSPIWLIQPNDGLEEEVYDKLKKVENLVVYKKEEIPEKFHYTHNRRISPLVIVAKEGYEICHENNASTCFLASKGNHGYSNDDVEMHNIFIAHGPKFKKGYKSAQFESVDIYPLLCHILDVEAAPNNGSLQRISSILYVFDNALTTLVTYVIVTLACASISLLCCIGAYRSRKYRPPSRKYATVVMSDLPNNDHNGKTRLLSDDQDASLSEEEIP